MAERTKKRCIVCERGYIVCENVTNTVPVIDHSQVIYGPGSRNQSMPRGSFTQVKYYCEHCGIVYEPTASNGLSGKNLFLQRQKIGFQIPQDAPRQHRATMKARNPKRRR